MTYLQDWPMNLVKMTMKLSLILLQTRTIPYHCISILSSYSKPSIHSFLSPMIYHFQMHPYPNSVFISKFLSPNSSVIFLTFKSLALQSMSKSFSGVISQKVVLFHKRYMMHLSNCLRLPLISILFLYFSASLKSKSR